MPAVVIDTDVASRLHRRTLPAETGELLKWAEVRSWGSPRRGRLDAWLSAVPTLPYHRGVAASWARLVAAAERRGRPRPVNDTWIAACCVAYEVPRTAAEERAEQVLAEHGSVTIVPAGFFDALLAALDDPARANPTLARGAAKAHESVTRRR
ncbi:MAG TPA: DUF1778 domain-containing protein [Mycobacteriales bacterium]|nr:DUF1778 domain-containing protein [Mycobacteriales bacterium]